MTDLIEGILRMKKAILIMLMVTAFCLQTIPLWAAVYVSDNLEAPVRNGPGTQHRIVGVVQSGQPVEALSESDGWTLIRYKTERGDREGWILSRYLMNREPWEEKAQALKDENIRLRETASPMAEELREKESENDTLRHELAEKTGELEELRTAYETLQKEASNFLELKKEFEKTRADYLEMERRLAETVKENDRLLSSESRKWFYTGAAVLVTGLLFGFIMGRREKKRRSSKIY